MSDLDLELLQAWSPEPVAPSPEVRNHALTRLEQVYDDVTLRPTSVPTRHRFATRVAIAAVAATALIAGSVALIQRQVDDRVDRIETVTVPAGVLGGGEVAKGPVNILLVGSDSRANLDDNPAFGTEVETGPPRSDTMILLHLDGTAARALWIPRDLLVGTTGKINSTFNEGPQALIEAINANLSVSVDHYVEVDFTGFQRIVDEIGGVPVYSPGQVRDRYSGLDLSGPGCRTLDGAAALSWVRSRHLEVLQNGVWVNASPGADLDRIAHQQELMRSLTRRAKAQVSGDPVEAVDLVDALLPALKIDSDFTKSEILAFVRALIGIDPGSALLATLPVETAPDGASLVLRQPDAQAALAPFTGGPIPTEAPATTTTVPPPAC